MNKQSQSDSSQVKRNMSESAPSQLAAGAAAQGSQGQQQSGGQSQSSQSQGANAAENNEVFDPVCGMAVEINDESTEQLKHKGRVLYFCSAECREQYEASPDDFQE